MAELYPTLKRDADRAMALKERGNRCFDSRDFAGAYDCYSRALKLAPPLPKVWGDLPDFARLRLTLFSNRALAAFQLGWMLACIADCSSSIAHNFRDSGEGWQDRILLRKALVRRAAAWRALDDLARAQGDLQEAARHGHTGSTEEGPAAASAGPGAFWGRLPDEPLIRVAGFLPPLTLWKFQRLDKSSLALCQQSAVWEQQLGLLSGPLSKYEACWTDGSFIKECNLPEVLTAPPAARCKLWPRAPRNLGPLGCFPPLVVDVGTVYTKVGFAGAALPSVLLWNHQILDRSAEIISMGLFTDESDSLRRFFGEAVFGALRADPRRHPVVLCLSLFQHRQYPERKYLERARLVEDALRDLGVPQVVSCHSPCLALFSHKQHTGVVVDVGLGVTRATPVVRGNVCVEAVCMQTLGAANCTNYLLEVLREREDLGSLTPPSEELSGYQVMMLVKLTKEEHGYVAASREEAERAPSVETPALSAAFKRPMRLGRELATVGEMFFTPSFTGPQHSYYGPSSPQPRLGLHQLALRAVGLCAPEFRPELLASVVLAGGACGLPGMQRRLQRELDILASASDSPVAGCAPRVLDVIPEVAWHGGSVVGSELWRTRPIRVEHEAGEVPRWSMWTDCRT